MGTRAACSMKCGSAPIVWHGGEARSRRGAVVRAAAAERADLLRFVESL